MIYSLSVSQTAALVVLLALLARPALCAPAEHRPWDEPCGTHKEDTGATLSPNLKQPAMKAVKRVRTQLRIANNHYKKETSNINSLYAEVQKVLKGKHYNYSWLPRNQVKWYNNHARCLERNRKMATVLPALHTALQMYLMTFEELKQFPVSIQDPRDVAKIKKRVLNEMAKQIKKVLCEVETALLSSNIVLPTRASEKIIPKVDRNQWDPSPDHTTSLIQTWGVLTAYKTFLQEWHKIFQEAMKKPPDMCSRNDKKPPPKKSPTAKPKLSKPNAGAKPLAGGKPTSSGKPTASGKLTTKQSPIKSRPTTSLQNPKRKAPLPKHRKIS